ncbi:putative inositol-pentakisphosphate 2-kinase [Helianthus annuus]|nr:putative inositol-pentakisphosphate 2-kinase [Helianthus annuus]
MVELVVEAKDAADWIYRGEGGLNIVLAYAGSSPNFIGKVLRVRKIKKKKDSEGPAAALSEHERLVWKDVGGQQLLSAPTKDIANHAYAQFVLCPLLGSQHVDAGVRVLVTKEFLELIHNAVLLHRPSWRVDNGGVNTLLDSALLMSDHSIFPHGNSSSSSSSYTSFCGKHNQNAPKHTPFLSNYLLTICFSPTIKAIHEEQQVCISVEIKPKCGFLPTSGFIREENAAKRRISRFRLHQILKFHQRKISQISEYDPLDMFSGSKGRVAKSVKDLFLTPQNNFRVFLDGRLVFGSLGGEVDDTNTQIAEAFEDTLKGFFKTDDDGGMRIPEFLQLVAGAVSESGILDRLLQVQKLDAFDIEGAIHAYYDVVSQPCSVCKELQTDGYHSISFDQSLKIVRDFLISLTAKDLSLMISFRPTPKGNSQSPPYAGTLYLESLNQSFDYKASFIDLDMKPLEKMPYYYKLDQEIVSCYTRMMKTVNHPEKSESLYQDQSSAIEDNSHT